VVVFGCGGGRDLGKRPLMGEIATRLADRVVVTSDNPRNEHPEQIINQILSGISAEALGRVEIDPDRQKAIETAIRLLRSDDILVVAGKGHEDYQIIGEKKIHFSDQEIVQAALNLKKH
jgi:UDP-N-acetylmuramoyl-L-alanyl-D-glutamate--2,6-diaminopimelate ligase